MVSTLQLSMFKRPNGVLCRCPSRHRGMMSVSKGLGDVLSVSKELGDVVFMSKRFADVVFMSN